MNKRESEIYTAAHMYSGYSKLSSEHLAFIKGAEWADKNPSDDIINKIVSLYITWNNSGESLIKYIKENI